VNTHTRGHVVDCDLCSRVILSCLSSLAFELSANIFDEAEIFRLGTIASRLTDYGLYYHRAFGTSV